MDNFLELKLEKLLAVSSQQVKLVDEYLPMSVSNFTFAALTFA